MDLSPTWCSYTISSLFPGFSNSFDAFLPLCMIVKNAHSISIVEQREWCWDVGNADRSEFSPRHWICIDLPQITRMTYGHCEMVTLFIHLLTGYIVTFDTLKGILGWHEGESLHYFLYTETFNLSVYLTIYLPILIFIRNTYF